MLLGKRQRPPMKRTTSMSEITFDLNLSGESEPSDRQNQLPLHDPRRKPVVVYGPNGQLITTIDHRHGHHGLLDQRFLATVSPRGTQRRHSADYSDAGYFLRSCSLCKRLLVPGRDIYMYRGDSAFCSLECRQQQMTQDERKEQCGLVSKKEPAVSATASAAAGSAKGERVAAAV